MQLENNDEDHILNTYKIAINFNANVAVTHEIDPFSSPQDPD